MVWQASLTEFFGTLHGYAVEFLEGIRSFCIRYRPTQKSDIVENVPTMSNEVTFSNFISL